MSDQARLDSATEFLSAEPADEDRQAEIDQLSERVIEALRTVYDPEIPVNIFELGLIYKIDVDDRNDVHIDMTLTSPMCPVAETLPEEVKTKVEAIDGVTAADGQRGLGPAVEPQHDDRGGAAGARHPLLRPPCRLPLGAFRQTLTVAQVRRRISSSSWSSERYAMLSVPPLPRGCSRTRRPSRPDRSRSTASVLASRGLGLPGLIALPLVAHQRLGLPHIESAGDHLPRQRRRIARAEQRPGVPCRQLRRRRASRAPARAGRAAGSGWRCGCGSCPACAPAPPGYGRTRRSGAGSRPPPRAASGPGAARSRAARAPAPRGRTARRRPPAARGSRRAGRRASAARRRRSRTARRRRGTRRTSSGCITPLARIDSASAASSSSPKWRRGWSADGRRNSIGTMRTPSRVRRRSGAPPSSADRPMPRPRLRAPARRFGLELVHGAAAAACSRRSTSPASCT